MIYLSSIALKNKNNNMKFRLLPTLFIAVAAMILFSACSKKSNNEGRYVPADAMIVMVLDGESLSAKLPWEEVKSNNAFKEVYADSSLDAFAKTAMDNPENTGIDIKKDMVFFIVKDSSGGYASIQGTVKDAAKFKAYNTAAIKNATASQKDGIDYITGERVTVSWNKDRFVMIADMPEMNQISDMKDKNPFDTSFAPAPPVVVKSTRNTVDAATAVYKLTEENSLAKEERFSKLVNEKSDVNFWMNLESVYKDIPTEGAMAMMNMSKLYEGSRFAGSANFENGKIDIKLKSYAGKELTEVYKKYGGSKISSDMTSRLASKDIALFFAMNFKPEGIKEFFRVAGLDGIISMASMMLGFNMDDFVRANKGDILLSISDFSKDTLGKPTPKVLFAASIGEKASFDKLIAAGEKAGKSDSSLSTVSYNKNDKYFVIGNDKVANDAFLLGKGSKPAFLDKISDGPIAGYANIQYILNAMQSESGTDSLKLEAFRASQKFWDYATLSGGNFTDGGITQHAEIHLMDKNSNSLKQLNKYIDELALIHKKQKAKQQTGVVSLPTETITGIDTSARVQ
jgi:hypothetical protein